MGGGGEGRGVITFSRDNLLLLPWKRGAYSRGGYMRKKSLFKTEGGGGGGLFETRVNREFPVIVLFLAG